MCRTCTLHNPQLAKEYITIAKGAVGSGTDEVAAAGDAEILFGPVLPGQHWEIGRIVLDADGAASGAVIIYGGGTEGSVSPNLIRDKATTGDDVRSYYPPIVIHGSEFLRVRWTGATAASRVTAVIQYDIVMEATRVVDEYDTAHESVDAI